MRPLTQAGLAGKTDQWKPMIAVQADSPERTAGFHRAAVAISFAVAIAAFVSIPQIFVLSRYATIALNDIAWALASLVAALLCGHVAFKLRDRERIAWLFFASGCSAWFIGQGIWTWLELTTGLPPFPHWMQLFFSAYDWLFIAGLWTLPKPPGASGFTPRHGGNLVLILCTLVVILVVALLEPALLPQRNRASNGLVGLHTLGLAAIFFSALYLVWSYQWRSSYWPLMLIATGAAIHTATYIAYIHLVMTDRYLSDNWTNVSWLFIFAAYACAAYERLWRVHHPPDEWASRILRRERWLEALVPALLIALMLAEVWLYRNWISQRTAAWATAAALVFAMALGLRELWIQRHEQKLLDKLNDLNKDILLSNRELTKSESRYRVLSTELEQRVADRTLELQQAYRDLENFSYAVAHDLKAPLRAVDGFGALLAADCGDKLDEKGRGYLQRMRRNALRMADLIDDLLAYARVDRREFNLSAVPLKALLGTVVQEQSDDIDRFGVKLQLQVDALAVYADHDGLLVACRNLLQNAIKFSKDSSPPSIVITTKDEVDGVCISVRDNGIGFDMVHHEQIFKMFQRLHGEGEIPGTGIGLALVYKAAERMRGRVWATSAPGEGATFYLLLPRSQGSAPL